MSVLRSSPFAAPYDIAGTALSNTHHSLCGHRTGKGKRCHLPTARNYCGDFQAHSNEERSRFAALVSFRGQANAA
ncbi:MAG TPA: hypothetical protein DCG12_18995 [Planctomycetaceae bacterium]|nr:hypothetical protein [Planctomycetaceae bacterium]